MSLRLLILWMLHYAIEAIAGFSNADGLVQFPGNVICAFTRLAFYVLESAEFFVCHLFPR